jgi:hypothetical protein
LVLVERVEEPSPWSDELLKLIIQYSTNRDFQPYNLIEELTSRGLYQVEDQTQTEAETFTQSIADYIESVHSRNGFSRDRMAPEAAVAFDAAARAIIAPHAPDDTIMLRIRARLVWGQPLAPDIIGAL